MKQLQKLFHVVLIYRKGAITIRHRLFMQDDVSIVPLPEGQGTSPNSIMLWEMTSNLIKEGN